ncbi:MAG: hypothetical protein R3E83_13465 [Burkholderiaceae bacterium]
MVGALVEKYLFRPVIRRSKRERCCWPPAWPSSLDTVILLLFGEKQRGVPKIIKGVFLGDTIIMPYDRIVIGVVAVVLIDLVHAVHAIQQAGPRDARAGARTG